jgi:hypothetical protein
MSWITFKGGTGHTVRKGKVKKGIGVGCKDDYRKHQGEGDLTLARTQDPSSPDDDAICDNILNKDPGNWVSARGMLVDDESEYEASRELGGLRVVMCARADDDIFHPIHSG